MKTYKITLSSLGQMSELPDSQKIFGALIWKIKNEENMIKNIFDENKVESIEVSNLFPENYLPNIYFWDKNIEFYLNIEDEKYVFNNKEYKIHTNNSDIDTYKTRSWKNNNNNEYDIKITETFRDRMNFEQSYINNENGVFSQNVLNLFYVEEDNEKECKRFVFYLKTNIEIENLIEKNNILKLGKRVSQGMNIYEVLNIENINIEDENTEYYLNIGMMGLNNLNIIDLDKSAIKTYRSSRKGLIKYNEVYKVEYIDSGSIIKLQSNTIKKYEKLSDNRYLYTAGFLLPIKRSDFNEETN